MHLTAGTAVLHVAFAILTVPYSALPAETIEEVFTQLSDNLLAAAPIDLEPLLEQAMRPNDISEGCNSDLLFVNGGKELNLQPPCCVLAEELTGFCEDVLPAGIANS